MKLCYNVSELSALPDDKVITPEICHAAIVWQLEMDFPEWTPATAFDLHNIEIIDRQVFIRFKI